MLYLFLKYHTLHPLKDGTDLPLKTDVKPNVLASSRYMRITGLPRTATPADVRRLCVKNKVENTESCKFFTLFVHNHHLTEDHFPI